jgi:hypothetical protein
MSGLKAHEGKPFVFMLGSSVFERMPDARRHVWSSGKELHFVEQEFSVLWSMFWSSAAGLALMLLLLCF